MAVNVLGWGWWLDNVEYLALEGKVAQLEGVVAGDAGVEASLQAQETRISLENVDLTQQLQQANAQLNSLLEQQNAGLNQASLEARDYWDNKDPQASITYADRLIPGTSTVLDMDIRLPCQPSDPFILNWLKVNNLMVADPNHCEKEMLAIYRLHQQTWMQWAQLPIWGVLEYWCFPFEMRARVTAGFGAVCHDFAPSLISCLLTAGVPAFRVRGVCGTTYDGGGHSTVAVLADDLQTWQHMNSTSPPFIIPLEFSGLSAWGDPNGVCSIKNAWFSYSKDYCWSGVDVADDPAYQKVIGQKLKIVPV